MTVPAQATSTVVQITVAHRSSKLAVQIILPAAVGQADSLSPVLFSHGDRLDVADYARLTSFWACSGLAVFAPTHTAPETGEVWLARALDLLAVADQLPTLTASVPALRGRVADGLPRVAGHSFGAHSAALALGAVPYLTGTRLPERARPHFACGLFLAPPGDGGPRNLTADWASRAPYLSLDWSGARTHALVVVGGRDSQPMTHRGWRWHTDGFVLSPAGTRMLAVAPDGDHYLGGITNGLGRNDPALLDDIQAATASYLLEGAGWVPPRSTPGLIFHASNETFRGEGVGTQ